jgi:hypothetical protein
MSEKDRLKLENEAKSWLQIQILKAVVETGAGDLSRGVSVPSERRFRSRILFLRKQIQVAFRFLRTRTHFRKRGTGMLFRSQDRGTHLAFHVSRSRIKP